MCIMFIRSGKGVVGEETSTPGSCTLGKSFISAGIEGDGQFRSLTAGRDAALLSEASISAGAAIAGGQDT